MPESTQAAYDGFQKILKKITFPEYTFRIVHNKGTNSLYLQAEYIDADVITGKAEVQKTRKWLLSPFMTRSEFVQTAFKCALTSMEHRTREHFLYKAQRVYSPHYDVEALVELCKADRFDERTDWYLEQRLDRSNIQEFSKDFADVESVPSVPSPETEEPNA